MATSESDSENDFASADEGETEAVSDDIPKSVNSCVQQPPEIPVSTSSLLLSGAQFEEKAAETSDCIEPNEEKAARIAENSDCIEQNAETLENKEVAESSGDKAETPKSVITKEANENFTHKDIDEYVKTLKKEPPGSADQPKHPIVEEPKIKEVANKEQGKYVPPEEPKIQAQNIKDDITEHKAKVLLSKESQETVKPNRKTLLLEKKLDKTAEKISDRENAVLERLCAASKEDKKISPGWGLGWSSSFISSAASSVSTFTSHVTQGIESVLETVEATLGAPTPEELASTVTKRSEESAPVPNKKVTPDEDGILPGSLMGGVTAFTRVLESTGSKVLTGGLDTLELIGKKTMDILTEGDPGLRNKRMLFGGETLTLSQILRESRDKVDGSSSPDSPSDIYPVHYTKLFDEFQGLVHLEALEILSEECKGRVEDERSSDDKLQGIMEDIKSLCLDLPPTDDTPDEEMIQDFEDLVFTHCSALSLPFDLDKIRGIQAEAKSWIAQCRQQQNDCSIVDAKEIYRKAISAMCEMTARTMEFYHKLAEIVLVSSSDITEVYNYAKHLTRLTGVLCTEIGILASQFGQCLGTAADDSEDPDSINPLITNVFLEASNSNAYIQDAFQLVIPVLQDVASVHFNKV